mmetsp:Transcript_19818/g.32125  ORF Transcript_19818/g.32125 Transcript_19818/m.32125 type:complete len:340 (+) Transcript_19818:2301-3320(+)
MLQCLGNRTSGSNLGNKQMPQEVPANRAYILRTKIYRWRASCIYFLYEPALFDRCCFMRVVLTQLRCARSQVSHKQGLPHEELVQGYTSRPHIGFLALRMVLKNLRCHVLEGSCQCCGRLDCLSAPAEVSNLQHALVVYEQVIRLYISVDDSEFVQRTQALHQLASPHYSRFLAEFLGGLLVELPEKISLTAQLHQQEDIFTFLHPVVQTNDVILHICLECFSRCQLHCANLLIYLPLDASQCKIRSVHDLHSERLHCVTTSHLEDLRKCTTTKHWCVQTNLEFVAPCPRKWRRALHSELAVHGSRTSRWCSGGGLTLLLVYSGLSPLNHLRLRHGHLL